MLTKVLFLMSFERCMNVKWMLKKCSVLIELQMYQDTSGSTLYHLNFRIVVWTFKKRFVLLLKVFEHSGINKIPFERFRLQINADF